MKITTGLFPIRASETHDGQPSWATYFEDPTGEARHVLYTRTEPDIAKKGLYIILYSDRPGYNLGKDANAREDHGIPEDALVEDLTDTTPGTFIRRYTWYEVTA